MNPFLEPLLVAGCTLDVHARIEIAKWTGGVPLLLGALLRRLWDSHGGSCISKPHIDQAAESLLQEQWGLLDELWVDCDVALRADLAELFGADIPLEDLTAARRRQVRERGFSRELKTRMRGSCRLMQRYAGEQAPAVADLTRLFGTAPGFESNIRSLLELRLAQFDGPNVDRDLRESVSNAVRDLKPHPSSALTWIRRISGRALALIWEVELPPDKALPAEWINEWRHAGIRNLPEDRGRLPRGAGAQCNVLRLITGTDRTPRQSRYVTKTTYLLVDHMQSVGDFGQHQEDYPEATVSIGIAASFVLTAISLLESLTADLHRQEGAV